MITVIRDTRVIRDLGDVGFRDVEGSEFEDWGATDVG